MKSQKHVVETVMKYPEVVVSMVVLLMLFGMWGLKNMPRDEFPQFTIRQGLIVGVFPGATSAQVEAQLTTAVENYIFGYKEIDKDRTYSHSQEGQMVIYVELNDDVVDADRFWSKLRHGLDELKMQLPRDVVALIGTNDFGDTSALLVTMSSPKKSYRQLEDVMTSLEAQIRKVPSVSKIKVSGKQKETIFVYVDPKKLNEYKLSATTILGAFKTHELINYSGKIDNEELLLPVHVPPNFTSEEDLEQLIVYSDPTGNTIRLKDIARVERSYSDPETLIKNNRSRALILSLEMQAGNNIVQFGDDVQKVLNRFKDAADDDIEINVISNQPQVVHESIAHFMKELAFAIISVIIVTMLLLPFRVSSVAAVTIPVSILITLGIMYAAGIQLDIVSLAGLIVVLGMVVDNAIVVIDNHVEKIDQGDTPWQAAWKAATELFVPILSATAAISAAFFPLMLFMVGLAADFVAWFPLTIGIALGVSLLVAMLLVPFMCFLFIKKGLRSNSGDSSKKKRPSLLDAVQFGFDRGLNGAFRAPVLTILFGVASVAVAVYLFTGIKQQLFPVMERNQFAVEVYLPKGAALHKTETVIDELEAQLLKDSRVTNVASFVGTSSPRFHALYAPHIPAPNFGQLMVNTVSNEATSAVVAEYEKKYRNRFPEAHITWKQLAMEKFLAPIEVRISGDDIALLKDGAEKVAAILNQNEKTTWVRSDWEEPYPSVALELDKDKSNRLGYAKTFISASLITALDGLPLTTVWEEDYPVNVLLSVEETAKDDIQQLENQYIASPITMNALPLRSIAQLKADWNEGIIVRRNGVRTLTVSANVTRDVTYSEVFKEVRPAIDKLRTQLPKGIDIDYGGEYRETLRNFVPMYYALGTSVVIIFFILLLQFKTIKKALVVMSTMLLSLFGAVAGLLVVGYPFGLTSFIGLIGLMGITVRNGIILVDYAEQLVRDEKMTFKDAALAAGKRRMRPIFLTSAAAAVGVVPMIISRSPLWGPLATVICFGLIFGMIFTLFILPVLYWITAEPQKKSNESEDSKHLLESPDSPKHTGATEADTDSDTDSDTDTNTDRKNEVEK
ncbi:MAG: efflux RND transporter permease subunit [Deltaproteobacteria bacterium]|nr:efflux RND transporter permease subunit [Deltaproteobacteria bacterium]